MLRDGLLRCLRSLSPAPGNLSHVLQDLVDLDTYRIRAVPFSNAITNFAQDQIGFHLNADWRFEWQRTGKPKLYSPP